MVNGTVPPTATVPPAALFRVTVRVPEPFPVEVRSDRLEARTGVADVSVPELTFPVVLAFNIRSSLPAAYTGMAYLMFGLAAEVTTPAGRPVVGAAVL